ncbi:MAG TPA: ATP-binding protein [Gammaproteobacteria bacterium]|nr:ATP-binding protein [Gammaproteobacteria bacterium]
MYKRHIMPSLLAALADTPVVFLNGARQTGKSTLVQEINHKEHPARYLSFDDPTILMAAKNDPVNFINHLNGPVVLDEIQKAIELFPVIKLSVDKNRQAGRFLLTGSANVLLLPSLSESLAGRMEVLTLFPLSQGEIYHQQEQFIDYVFEKQFHFSSPLSHENRTSLIKRILAGGYPEALMRIGTRRKAWFDAYITTILQRDIRDLSNIEGLINLPNLLKLLTTRISGLLNLSEVSRSVRIPHTTLKRYFSLLETTFLCITLPAWSNNLGNRLVKSPKIFLNDTGLATALLGLNEERYVEDGLLFGRLLENFVVVELQKQRTWSKIQPYLYHFRTAKGQEVDLILEDASGRCVGIEVKASATLFTADMAGLATFAELAGKRFHRGIVLYTGKEIVPLGKNIFAMPIAKIFEE